MIGEVWLLRQAETLMREQDPYSDSADQHQLLTVGLLLAATSTAILVSVFATGTHWLRRVFGKF